jgi:hypothetical protein
VAMACLLIDHGAHVHQQNGKQSELHTLAKTQKGPYPAVHAPHLPKEKHHHTLTPQTHHHAHAPPCPTMAQLLVMVGVWWVNTVQRWAMPSPAVKFWQLLLDIGASPNWYDDCTVTHFIGV